MKRENHRPITGFLKPLAVNKAQNKEKLTDALEPPNTEDPVQKDDGIEVRI